MAFASYRRLFLHHVCHDHVCRDHLESKLANMRCTDSQVAYILLQIIRCAKNKVECAAVIAEGMCIFYIWLWQETGVRKLSFGLVHTKTVSECRYSGHAHMSPRVCYFQGFLRVLPSFVGARGGGLCRQHFGTGTSAADHAVGAAAGVAAEGEFEGVA